MVENGVTVDVDETMKGEQSRLLVRVFQENQVRAELILARKTNRQGVVHELVAIAAGLLRGKNKAISREKRERAADVYLAAADKVPDL